MAKIPAFLLLSCWLYGQELYFSEIMYHPIEGEALEYVELHVKTGGDFSGFKVTGGVECIFPQGIFAQTGAYIVLAQNPQALTVQYPGIAIVLPMNRNLGNGGDTVILSDAGGNLLEQVTYDDDPPWDFAADGFGFSLNRLCLDHDAHVPHNWRAMSPTPGRINDAQLCPPVEYRQPAVLVSEVMYHPCSPGLDERQFEYVELHNPAEAAISLADWELKGETVFRFNETATIPAGGYAVVAASPADLLALYPGLDSRFVFGPFSGDLDNGGGKVALFNDLGVGVDAITYNDDFPWPQAPDGYGEIPGKGHSLERLSMDLPSGLFNNWQASPRDAPTPGRPNTFSTPTLPLKVHQFSTSPDPIQAGDAIAIAIQPTHDTSADRLRLAYFTRKLPTDAFDPDAVPFIRDGNAFQAIIPGQEGGTWIRWRVEHLQDDHWQPLLPAPDAPRRSLWLGLFVPPPFPAAAPVYHLSIKPTDWTQLYKNAFMGRILGDTLLESWNASVPASFAHGNHVHDVSVRFHGSQWHRSAGFDATDAFEGLGPADNYPVRLLSFRIAFPRYDPFNRRRAIILNKQHEWKEETGTTYFHGLQIQLGMALFREAGVPASETGLAHLFINGGYYHLMAEIERPGEDMLARHFPETGDLFKASGCPRGVFWAHCGGPVDWSDGRPLPFRDGYRPETLYASSYERKTRRYASHEALQSMIEGLDQAAQAGNEALAEYMADHFDKPVLLNYLATANWGCAWDDIWQNYYLHRSAPEKRWSILPWDMDQMFGGPCCCARVDPETSIWRGTVDCPDNWAVDGDTRHASRFKHYGLTAFRDDYFFQLLKLNNTIFKPDPLLNRIREIAETLRQEGRHSPLPLTDGHIDAYKNAIADFAVRRHDHVNSLLIPAIDAGQDVIARVGEAILFDATASSPEPGPDVLYRWSNGMTGAAPSHTFTTPGTQVITLTISRTFYHDDRQVQVSRSRAMTVRVYPDENCRFLSSGQAIVVEAESFHAMQQGAGDFENAAWHAVHDENASAGKAMGTIETGPIPDDAQPLHKPELNYWVKVDDPDFYNILFRARAGTGYAPQLFSATLSDHTAQPIHAETISVGETAYQWYRMLPTPRLMFPGAVMLSIQFIEPGIVIDKMILSPDMAFLEALEGTGPPQSPQKCRQGPFIRGDVNEDAKVDLGDAITLLGHLFLFQETIACKDRGDVNDDGTLNLADPVYILQYLYNQGPAPLSPFPAPGWDPTADDAFYCGDAVK